MQLPLDSPQPGIRCFGEGRYAFPPEAFRVVVRYFGADSHMSRQIVADLFGWSAPVRRDPFIVGVQVTDTAALQIVTDTTDPVPYSPFVASRLRVQDGFSRPGDIDEVFWRVLAEEAGERLGPIAGSVMLALRDALVQSFEHATAEELQTGFCTSPALYAFGHKPHHPALQAQMWAFVNAALTGQSTNPVTALDGFATWYATSDLARDIGLDGSLADGAIADITAARDLVAA